MSSLLLVCIVVCLAVVAIGVGVMIGLQLKRPYRDPVDQWTLKAAQDTDDVVRYYTNLQKFIVDVDGRHGQRLR